MKNGPGRVPWADKSENGESDDKCPAPGQRLS